VGIRALGHRNYRLFFTGQLISVVGSWMQSMAQAWLVYRLTGSEVLLGLVGFADKVPVFALGLAGGVVADRFDRHRVVLATQTASMLQALALGLLVVSGHATVPALMALAALQGIINAFDLPARQSFISTMVEMDDLPNALALNSSVFNAARVVGPALAGIIVAAIGEGPCFLLNAASYLAVIFCLTRMRFERRPGPAAVAAPSTHLLQGLRYAWDTRPVRALLVLLGLMSVCGMPYVVLMPIFAGEILGGGARGLGTLMGATGAGAFGAAVALARRRSVAGLGRVVAAGSIGFGASLMAFSASRSFVLSAAILAVTGFSMITQAAATNLLVQSLCPDALRGRVMSLYTVMFVGMAPWGSLMAGSLAHAIGTPATVAAGGAVCAAAGMIFAARIPSMRPLVRYPIPESPPPGRGESPPPRPMI
jgi:MFS family permease